MPLKPIKNHTRMPIYVNSAMIPPGETRHFEEADLPPEHRADLAAPEPIKESDPLSDLLDGSVEALITALPAIGAEDLTRAEKMEEDGKARKTALAAIAQERLRRGEEALGKK